MKCKVVIFEAVPAVTRNSKMKNTYPLNESINQHPYLRKNCTETTHSSLELGHYRKKVLPNMVRGALPRDLTFTSRETGLPYELRPINLRSANDVKPLTLESPGPVFNKTEHCI